MQLSPTLSGGRVCPRDDGRRPARLIARRRYAHPQPSSPSLSSTPSSSPPSSRTLRSILRSQTPLSIPDHGHTTRRPPSRRCALGPAPAAAAAARPLSARTTHARVHAHPTPQPHPNPHPSRAVLTLCAPGAVRRARATDRSTLATPPRANAGCHSPSSSSPQRRPRLRRPPRRTPTSPIFRSSLAHPPSTRARARRRALCVLAICSVCVRCVCAVCAPCVCCAFAVCALCVRCVCASVCVLRAMACRR
jgi:hypothetical protein